MAVHQRDVYILPHPFDSSVAHHPFIVLSVNEANIYESTFIGVMITSSENRFDDFSFQLTNEMFEKDLPKKDSHARMHLITLCLTEEIQGNQDMSINKMKPYFFKQLMAAIGDLIFNYEFTPLS